MHKGFRHAKSVDSVLAEVLIAEKSDASSGLVDLVRGHRWLWDFCLEQRVMDLRQPAYFPRERRVEDV